MSTSRKIKNVIYNYTDCQKKVRDATSNDPWGPSSTLMSEIADLTYNVDAFAEIMFIVWRRINDKGKNWRHVYKSLVVLEYIIKTGSERVALECRNRIVDIDTLKDFTFYDAANTDVGRNVREKSKHVVALLKDEERLKTERVQALKAKERFAQASQGIGSNQLAGGTTITAAQPTPPPQPQATTTSPPDPAVPGDGTTAATTPPQTRTLTSEIEQARPQTSNEEELQLQLALAMSKEEADQQRQEQNNERIRLEMAINESLDENTSSKELAGPPPPALKKRSSLLVLAKNHRARTHLTPPPPQSQDFIDPVAPTSMGADPWAPGGGMMAAPPVTAYPQPIPNDPWACLAAPPVPQPPADPWAPHGPPPAPAQAPDPWGSPANVPVPANDPWSATSAQPRDPDSDFDYLRSSNAAMEPVAPPVPHAPMIVAPMGGAFHLTTMEDSLPLQPMSGAATGMAKKPEDFLGENSSLVNLDSLVGPPKPAQLMPQAPNPFLSSGLMSTGGTSAAAAAAAAQHNPFQQQRQPAPTINQMRAEPMMAGGGMPLGYPGGGGMGAGGMMAASSLPPPLIPMSSGPSDNHMGTSQQVNNPFLL